MKTTGCPTESAAFTSAADSRRCSPANCRRTSRCTPPSSDAVDRGVPVYAECGGLMYLGESLSNLDGEFHPMIGAIPAVSSMSQKRLTLGYRDVEAVADGPLLAKGQRVRAHEFHWSVLEQPPDLDKSVYRILDQNGRADGFHVGNVWASYVHIHLGSHPSLAPRFVDICAPHSRAIPNRHSRAGGNP